MKIYYTTDQLINYYPEEFITSKNPKSVQVLNVSLVYEDPTQSTATEKVWQPMKHCQLHASFVQRDDMLDHYVCETCQPITSVKTFEQANNARSFELWFTDYAQREITITNNHHFIVELMLQF